MMPRVAPDEVSAIDGVNLVWGTIIKMKFFPW